SPGRHTPARKGDRHEPHPRHPPRGQHPHRASRRPAHPGHRRASSLARPAPPSVTPTALATLRPPPPGWNKHPPLPAPAHALATGGTPGGQTSPTAPATLLAAATVVLLARARAARRRAAASPA